ncbi:hypothetical protein GKE82_20570 [Conexibacter sp. W3-3-2]|uniref:Uncharacterized protein n=1 Tax=Paraconexibacter algicola TaxID=2133960 RepID=A0A2T4UM96_9ACTN|nr:MULTISPECIES: hypothetical protein [Solirubrobacterales]MTD46617.1 hypothetical protein [Conexibacter sp. W3-3-2]PTL60338.1 hypothetical protein C7Y72_12170 [Paraconexibacter algicola]
MPLPDAIADRLDRNRLAIRRDGRALVSGARPLQQRLAELGSHIQQARRAHDAVYPPRRRPA